MSEVDVKVKNIKQECDRTSPKLKRQVLVNFGLGRKKVFLIDGRNTLSCQFETYITSDPAFSCLFEKRFLVFQEFNKKFGTWVDIDNEETLSDGTVVRAIFFPKKIEVDDNDPVSIKRGRFIKEEPEHSCDVIIFDNEDQEDSTSRAVDEIDLCEDSEDELPQIETEVHDALQNCNERSKRMSRRRETACASERDDSTSWSEHVEEVGSTTDSVSYGSEAKSTRIKVECVTPPLQYFDSSASSVESTSDDRLQGPVVHSNSDVKRTTCVLHESLDILGDSGSAENVLPDCGASTFCSNVGYPPVLVPSSTSVIQSGNAHRGMFQSSEIHSRSSKTKCFASSTGYEDPDSLILPHSQQDHHSPYTNQTGSKGAQVRHNVKVSNKRVGQNKICTVDSSITQHENVAQTVSDGTSGQGERRNLIIADMGTVSSNDSSQGRSGLSCHQKTDVQNFNTKQKNGNAQGTSRSRPHISFNTPVPAASKLKPLDFKCWYEKHEVNHSLKIRNTRLQWAKNASRRDKSWKLNIFSDVSVFALLGNHVKRVSQDSKLLDEDPPPTFEMFWGCLTYRGPEVLVPLGNQFKSEVLSGLLRDEIVPFVKVRYPNVISRLQYFSCFSSHYKRIVVSEIMWNLMDLELWPNCLRDLSPLEHVWDCIAEKAENIYCSNKEEMISVITDIWQNDPDLQLMSRKFVASMQDIVNDVITQKGKHPAIKLDMA